MDSIRWSYNHLKNENSQQYLQEKIQALLEGPLRNKDDYEQEKAIKVFAEGMRDSESSLLYSRDIHPQKLDLTWVAMNKEEYMKRYKEVEQMMETNISRQYRHFITFL